MLPSSNMSSEDLVNVWTDKFLNDENEDLPSKRAGEDENQWLLL